MVGWGEPPTRGLVAPMFNELRPKRDPQFRIAVLEAYAYRCAVCGMEVGPDGPTALLEAAHLKWFYVDHDNRLDNGLCLCPLHHTALDLGLIGLNKQRCVEVSPVVGKGTRVVAEFSRLAGRALIGPVDGAQPVSVVNIDWHARNVFRAHVARAG